MTEFDAWALMVGGMSIAGGLFVLWIARIDAKQLRKAAQSHPAE